MTVDHDNGIIRNVKVLGFDSKNRRIYTERAMREAVKTRLYEGISVNIDHPHESPDQPRSSYDRFGKLINVRFVEGKGIYADLEYLETHPMARRVCEDAERGLGLFGLSHNADGEGREDDDRVFIVEHILDVRHVDLVADPATNRNLAESYRRRPAMKKVWMIEDGRLIQKTVKESVVTKARKSGKLVPAILTEVRAKKRTKKVKRTPESDRDKKGEHEVYDDEDEEEEDDTAAARYDAYDEDDDEEEENDDDLLRLAKRKKSVDVDEDEEEEEEDDLPQSEKVEYDDYEDDESEMMEDDEYDDEEEEDDECPMPVKKTKESKKGRRMESVQPRRKQNPDSKFERRISALEQENKALKASRTRQLIRAKLVEAGLKPTKLLVDDLLCLPADRRTAHIQTLVEAVKARSRPGAGQVKSGIRGLTETRQTRPAAVDMDIPKPGEGVGNFLLN
jgi:hypothetical protein